MNKASIIYYSYATELINHLRSSSREQRRPSLSRLESIIFGGIASSQSLRFWTDCVREMPKGGVATTDYIILLFCLFSAMENEEVDAIVQSYFADKTEQANVNRSAM